MSRPLRSIATVCLSGGLGEKLDAATRIGFDGVEIFENDLLTFDGTHRSGVGLQQHAASLD
jgi:4-hydroxyphenylpyruvate dioxygenase